MVQIIQGDLLKSGKNILVHQVNCQGVMGAGIAKQIRARYPHVYMEYKDFCADFEDKRELMGGVLMVRADKDTYIANVFSQLHFGSGLQTDYAALETGLREVQKVAKEESLSVGIPYLIGCGLAGGDWNVVSRIIEEQFPDGLATLYEFVPKRYGTRLQ